MKKMQKARIFVVLGLVVSFSIGCTISRESPPQKSQTQPARPNPATPGPTEKPSELPTTSTSSAKIYLIALEDKGISGPAVGCGDSLITVETQTKDAQAALQMLLQNHNQWYGQSGLYNALYQSDLKINRFESKAGKLEVDLAGNLLLGGVCDTPRVNDQLKATIRQSTTDTSPVIIRINGKLLEDLLSQK
jgi:hypothetical protein